MRRSCGTCLRYCEARAVELHAGGFRGWDAPAAGRGNQTFNLEWDRKNRLPSGREYTAFAILLLMILVVVPAFALYYSATRSTGTQGHLLGDLQLRSFSVGLAALNPNGPGVELNAVVYNGYSFGAVLAGANYSVYADGQYLGNGQTSHEYDFAPRSALTLSFPVTMGWRPAFKTVGEYIISIGDVNWEVNGTAKIDLGGVPILVSFKFATG